MEGVGSEQLLKGKGIHDMTSRDERWRAFKLTEAQSLPAHFSPYRLQKVFVKNVFMA
jgi:hypothetical protein